VFSKLIENFLKVQHKKSKADTSKRYIPKSIREDVYKSCGGQCSYIAKDGTRCSERKYLQIDHVLPYSLGGKTEPENLRLLCSSHNRLLAEVTFGKAKIQNEINFPRGR